MKKVLTLTFLLFLLFGCISKISYKATVIVDYSKYSQKGFFITESNSVNFDYTPLASMETIAKGETETIIGEQQFKYSARDRRLGKNTTSDQVAVKTSKRDYNIYDAIDEIVEQAQDLGADGIINFRFSMTGDRQSGYGYVVSGMAIRRK